MRIGEIAALAGVTPRAVRHYHHLGLLPEPERLPNGYRAYGVRHAVELARIRRLTELGLALVEIRDVLADDEGRELAEVLDELDQDLARQEVEIRSRRERLATVLDQARSGGIPPEGPVSPALAELLQAIAPSDSAMARKDRGHLALLDSMVDDEQREVFLGALRPLAEDPELAARTTQLYTALDELADAPADDPRIAPLAAEASAAVPDAVLRMIASELPAADHPFGEALLGDFAPAQAEVVARLMADLLRRAQEL
ncbi:Mercuric resistance operon regulatory protein [Streptomyces sp. YIM 130001]|uniref:MerR family transcriptional regulator n=1 Tax=Streptomyces sp. YIM 130001 TaxID=2259644 RepID=UPI000E65179B|nr:MerR family transcriptional regulator [Streptomyces sp. YIM 130001]RII17017.1 Mercuric resistance operon regulatory protein [Streptomyces sp. YIM 130001]